MNPGDVVLALMPEAGGRAPKLRPALLLASLPGPYQKFLLCGISTRAQNPLPNWDELLQPGHPDYGSSGLHHPSVIRLSFLHAAFSNEITGIIGRIDPSRLRGLLQSLSDHLRP
jgi:mRNA interferase MazF